MEHRDAIRRFWDDDAPTYDRSPGHRASAPAERAAWLATLEMLLPPAPCTVLDAGAGTGFLSLAAARLGHRVTALDLSPAMLEQLRSTARSVGLDVETVVGSADDPPPGPFDAVMERHLLWTLSDPAAALRSWRRVAPAGRLVLIESLWGAAGGPAQRARERAGNWLRSLRRQPPDHHDHYSPEVLATLPLHRGTSPVALIRLVEDSGWGPARLRRLRDVEWAMRTAQPLPDRLIGVTPRFSVTAVPVPTSGAGRGA